jgi:hypothetical protein
MSNIRQLTYLTYFTHSISVNDRRVLFYWRWKQICRKFTLEPLMFSCMKQNVRFFESLGVTSPLCSY